MERYLFMKSVLARLGDGGFLRKASARALRVLAAVAVAAGLVEFVHALRFTFRLEASDVPGGVVYALFFAAGVYMVVHATLIRAAEVEALPGGGLVAIPIASVAFRLVGEAAAGFTAAAAAGGGVLLWFAGGSSYTVLRDLSPLLPLPVGDPFPAGIRYMVSGAIRALLLLGAGRLLSELLGLVERAAGLVPIDPPARREGGPPSAP